MTAYDNELDYLVKSLQFVQERATTTLADLRQAKEDCETLKEDCTKIVTKRLLEAATKTHNHFNGEKTRLASLLKEIREDEKWIKRIITIVKKYYRSEK